MPKKNCYDTALGMLAKRPYAIQEISDKLLQKHFESVDVQETILRLKGKNFLNDGDFAFSRARYRATVSGWGKTRIRQELAQKGVASAHVHSALAELVEEEGENHNFKERAASLLSARFRPLREMHPNLETEEEKAGYYKEVQRRVAFLLRRGFSLEEAKSALSDKDADLTD